MLHRAVLRKVTACVPVGMLAAPVVFTMALLTTDGPGQRSATGTDDLFVYFGTYTGQTSKGIYVSRFDVASGVLSDPELAAESPNPSFLEVHPTGNFLYAVNEVSDYEGTSSGSVTAFAIDRATGKLFTLNRQASGGAGPAHLAVDSTGRNVLVANYAGGSVAVLPVGRDGKLNPPSTVIQHTGASVNPERQTQPHAHAINLDPGGRFAYAVDLGIDKVLIYRFDAGAGSLIPNDPPFTSVQAGAGPRHLALLRRTPFAYVINELACTMTVFARNSSNGGLRTIQTISTLPPGQSVAPGDTSAEIKAHPSGRFLYGSIRGHDSIAVFSIDGATGRLTHIENVPTGGKTPRSFDIDPSGRYLLAANQQSNSVVVFVIDPQNGRLRPSGQRLSVPSPVCVKFVTAFPSR